MGTSNCLNAIMNSGQIQKFLKLYDLTASDLTLNFSGYYKHVVIAKDKVFLFARNEEAAKRLSRELDIYETLSKHLHEVVAIPKLIERSHDKEVHYYEYGVVSKISGEEFSRYILKLSDDELVAFLQKLSVVIASWHNVKTSNFASVLGDSTEIEYDSFGEKLIRDNDLTSTLAQWRAQISSYITLSDTQMNKIESALLNLRKMDDVLIHWDVHEDQILVESNDNVLQITGVLDWEGAFIGHPVWEFNFAEWGLEIWQRIDRFKLLRQAMWRKYLEERNLSGRINENSLHIFYLVQETIWTLKQINKSTINFTGQPFNETMKIYQRYFEEALSD
ncbi:aminoglycoside phosphotransferase family protein [candidate division WWE3 bacterium]|uniref:Aminoglycoside phosphotransferase family protein n=1 Tax=candidate division WWE3 bacterium TaxID=2053526 RepID=A0A955LKK2_UNCKA|nr:aminoglycoside phosphotransferase family protein [candidate division WWE3 bacterium]